MRNPVVSLLTLVLMLLASAAFAQVAPTTVYQPLTVGDLQEQIDRQVVERLQEAHYSPVTLDDAFSRQLLHAYLDALDPRHSVFLASDIRRFERRFGDELDDGLREGRLTAAFEIFNTYQDRRVALYRRTLERLQAGLDSFDLNDAEYLVINPQDAPWPADRPARWALWTKYLENLIINMRLDENEDAAEDAHEREEPPILERLTRRFSNELGQVSQAEPIDVVAVYMGAYTHLYDPHTDYFSPKQSENFEINMKLSLQGIGAQLRSYNGSTEIVRLIPGGPAIESGKLKPGDQIIAVGEGKHGGFTNIVGMRLDESVQLIRGRKGTTVRLRVASGDSGDTRTVALVRDKIKLEAQAARMQIIELERNGNPRRIGLITLPSFYQGTADDVDKLLRELEARNVSGVILDLRNNGGGALGEAIELVGLFMASAPVVQIREADGDIHVLGHHSPWPVYSGPLVVLVNRLSASASEIFAGAVQDYGRGLIVGSRTFGKGTVQALLPLKQGSIKLTRAKFYRVTGASTQVRGVMPDIDFPPVVDPEEIGEGTLPHVLPWDHIDSTPYPQSTRIEQLKSAMSKAHQVRVASDPDFQYRVKRIALAREQNERERLSLQIGQRRAARQAFQQKQLALANAHRKAIGKKPFDSYQEFQDSEDAQMLDTGLPSDGAEEPDAYQGEAARILLDLVEIQRSRF
ncbi:MAG: carboxy terminal-processing peptidase [Nitrococcus sp.]|nr:carboxy terminal-processing peptidase [Nitrococcus sp.]